MSSPATAPTRIVFPGEPGSFAEDAAIAYFGPEAAVDRLPGFADVVEGVAAGRIDRGVVPIENVVFGTVQQVQDLIAASDVVVVGEVIVPVRLCLAAL
ncbi:MAG: prephenate dehydratase domain-containing protein, partial [Candidatus Limnocylindrales bacterium]